MKKQKHIVVSVAVCLFAIALNAQSRNFFQPVAENAVAMRSDLKPRDFFPKKYQTYHFDFAAAKTLLQTAPWEFTPAAREQKYVMSIPLPDGTMEDFSVWQVAMMDAELAAAYPEIRTYGGESLTTPGRTVRFSCTPRGFRAMVMQPDLNIGYVEPHTWGQDEYYIAYDRADLPQGNKYKLGEWPTTQAVGSPAPAMYVPPAEDRGNEIDPVQLKVYRYIAAATGEFTQDHGGTKPLGLAAVTEYTNMVSAIYEREAALRLQLVFATQNVIFTDPASDPYPGTLVAGWFAVNSDVLNQYCNFNSHDIGHVYGRYMGGGALGIGNLGAVCGNSKAQGCSAGNGINNYGDGFVSVIGQEVGHQLNGGHTWNSCGGGAGRQGQSAFEPGSGSTIMSYHGACGPDNIDGPGILGFHSGSVEEFTRFYMFGTGSTCGTEVATTNNPPIVTLNYPSNLFIPILTPFELNGSATDPDGDALVYMWEGVDAGPEIPLGQQQGNSALFRTYAPGTATNRYFPRLSTILANQTYDAELLPEYTRDVTLRFVARDNRTGGGGISWADVEMKSWGEAGPFLVTSPNAAAATWNIGEYVNVTWDVANTYAAPVNCKKVNIRLSTDGGLTYPTTLASGVENDGTHYVLVPDAPTATARVRIDAADNVFFDISNANFKIQQPTQPALTLGLSSDAADICLPGGFTTEVLTAGSLGFNSPVSLTITGDLPPGATATFSATTINPGQSSTLTIDLGGTTLEGVYTFNLEATATGSPTLIRPITIRLISNDFSALALQSPTDGSTGLGLTQILRWNTALDAESYDVQFSKNPSFTNILASATSTTLDSLKINFLLEKGTAYYWRVRPRNECGIHDWTEPFFFSTFPESCSMFGANDLPKNISASGTPTVESKLTINAGGPISSMNIRQIKGYHEFFGELEARLISPQGTEVILFDNRCANYNGFFNFGVDDNAPNQFPCPPPNNGQFYRAENPLTPFLGQDNTGTWILRVKDTEITSGGSLEVFRLEFCASVTVNPPYLVNNNPLLIQTGVNEVITQNLLLAEDANNTHNQLTFTLVTVPEFGFLAKDGFGHLNPGDQFTQADLDAGLIRFFDYGINGGPDGFRFTVSDGEGGFLGTPLFVIQPQGVSTGEPAHNALQFNLFPNPANDAVWLSLNEPAEAEMRVSLFNTAGQLVKATILPSGADRLQIQVAELPKGMYAVRLEGAASAGVRKLVLR